MILGLTGGPGCGKSTAAALFAERGYRYVDSDAIIRDQVLTSEPVARALKERFGGGVFTGSGAVDRPALGRIVFASDPDRLWLEEITHPPYFDILRSMLRKDPKGLWILEVPLLFEKALENWFDFTICVACDPASQLARLEQRGLDRALAGQRISKQLPLALKIELSDFVLWNDGPAAVLKEQIGRVLEALAQPGHAQPTRKP